MTSRFQALHDLEPDIAWREDAALAAALSQFVSNGNDNGCLVWQSTLRDGYGIVRVGTKAGKTCMRQVHRLMYTIVKGPVPAGLFLDHLCRVRACSNVEHLEPVTSQVNTLRGVGPTATQAKQTHCKQGHELNTSNVRLYRNKRHCRECSKGYCAAYRQRVSAALAADNGGGGE